MTGCNQNRSEGCALFRLLRVRAGKSMSCSVFQSQPNYILGEELPCPARERMVIKTRIAPWLTRSLFLMEGGGREEHEREKRLTLRNYIKSMIGIYMFQTHTKRY